MLIQRSARFLLLLCLILAELPAANVQNNLLSDTNDPGPRSLLLLHHGTDIMQSVVVSGWPPLLPKFAPDQVGFPRSDSLTLVTAGYASPGEFILDLRHDERGRTLVGIVVIQI